MDGCPVGGPAVALRGRRGRLGRTGAVGGEGGVNDDHRIVIGDRVIAFENSSTVWLDGKALPFSDSDIEAHLGHLAALRYWLEEYDQ
jgi:hypothetical protein